MSSRNRFNALRPTQRDGERQVFRVALLVLPGFSMMALSCAVEPLRSLNRHTGEPRYEWLVTSLSPGPVVASNGIAVEATHGIADAPPTDLTVVVSSLGAENCRDRSLFNHLRRVQSQKQLVGAISSGTLILARAGLLAGRRATIHWETEPLLRAEFPDLEICRTLYCRDGNVLTAGGGTAAMDMMLDLIASRDGHAAATSVAEQFLHGRRRSGEEPQRDDVSWRYQLTDRRLEQAIRIMEGQLSAPLRVARIAEIVGLSERQLERLFYAALGASPSHFYMDLRLRAARAKLLESTETIEEIAEATGFSSQAHFSRAMKAWCGVSPRAIRVRESSADVGTLQKDGGTA